MYNFSEVCDKLRIYNEMNVERDPMAVTITSRKKFSTIQSFRQHLYGILSDKYRVDVIPEYHSSALLKLHAHGFIWCEPKEERINIGDLSLYTKQVSDLQQWKKYCTKELIYTLEHDNDIQNGIIKHYKTPHKCTIN